MPSNVNLSSQNIIIPFIIFFRFTEINLLTRVFDKVMQHTASHKHFTHLLWAIMVFALKYCKPVFQKTQSIFYSNSTSAQPPVIINLLGRKSMSNTMHRAWAQGIFIIGKSRVCQNIFLNPNTTNSTLLSI